MSRIKLKFKEGVDGSHPAAQAYLKKCEAAVNEYMESEEGKKELTDRLKRLMIYGRIEMDNEKSPK